MLAVGGSSRSGSGQRPRPCVIVLQQQQLTPDRPAQARKKSFPERSGKRETKFQSQGGVAFSKGLTFLLKKCSHLDTRVFFTDSDYMSPLFLIKGSQSVAFFYKLKTQQKEGTVTQHRCSWCSQNCNECLWAVK